MSLIETNGLLGAWEASHLLYLSIHDHFVLFTEKSQNLILLDGTGYQKRLNGILHMGVPVRKPSAIGFIGSP